MKNRFLAALAALLFASPLAAEITIQIDRGYDNPKKIGVVPFGVGAGVQDAENPSAIISFDLARSGQFSPTPPENMLSMPTAPKDVLFRDWRVLGVEYVVIGRTEVAANGDLAVSYYLFDVLNERQLANETFTAPPSALRDMAHLVSDAVYEKLTGIPGAFSTRIVYVLARDLGTKDVKFNLEMADADGARPRTLLESREPILSAACAIYIVLLGAHARGLANYWRTPAILRTREGCAAVGLGDDEHFLGLIHLGPKRQEQPPPGRPDPHEFVTYLP